MRLTVLIEGKVKVALEPYKLVRKDARTSPHFEFCEHILNHVAQLRVGYEVKIGDVHYVVKSIGGSLFRAGYTYKSTKGGFPDVKVLTIGWILGRGFVSDVEVGLETFIGVRHMRILEHLWGEKQIGVKTKLK